MPIEIEDIENIIKQNQHNGNDYSKQCDMDEESMIDPSVYELDEDIEFSDYSDTESSENYLDAWRAEFQDEKQTDEREIILIDYKKQRRH